MKKATILASGGIDSSTLIALLDKEGYEIHALSFDYAQRHAIELKKIKAFIRNYSVKNHQIIKIDLSFLQSSTLINKELEVEEYSNSKEAKGVPGSYVPARNSLFLNYALAYSEANNIQEIYIGAHASDFANYPDCRPEFFEKFEAMANSATSMGQQGLGFRIKAPLLYMEKAYVIAKGIEMGVDYSQTISCYQPSEEKACGKCLSCQVRQEAFKANNLTDPAPYL